MAGKTLKTAIIIGGAMSGSFRAALTDTKSGLKRIGDEILNIEKRQRSMGRRIEDLAKMGKGTSAMRAGYAALGREADRLRVAQDRLYKAEKRIQDNRARRQEIGGQLRGATATFGAIAAATFLPIREAVNFETAMLGVAKQVNGARDSGGKLTPIYFAMRKEILKLGRELPITTNGIADLVTAGARMGIAQDQLIQFARTSAMMSTAFELPEGELAESMGKVAGIFKIPIPAIAELGDAINSLDDGSAARGGDIIRVLQGDLAGAASTMGLSAKNAAALASTFLTLGESAERADTAAAGMMRQLQVAKMNPKRFQVGVKMLGLSGDELQKGMVNDPQAMILDVLTRIKKLPVEEQMEAVTRLFGKDWGGAIAKLANGVDEYRKQIDIANGQAAKGSMGREFAARINTTDAQMQLFKNRTSELGVEIGSALLPALNGMLGTVGPIVTKMAEWAARNPGVVTAIIGTATALATLRVAVIGARLAAVMARGGFLDLSMMLGRTGASRAAQRVGALNGSLGTLETASGRAAIGLAGFIGKLGLVAGLSDIAIQGAGALGLPTPGEIEAQGKGAGADMIRRGEWLGASANLPAGDFIGAAYRRVTGQSNSEVAEGIDGKKVTPAVGRSAAPKGKAPPVAPKGKAPPAVPASSAGAGTTTTTTDNRVTNITVSGVPGESTEDLARRIRGEIERLNAMDRRGRLADAA